MLFLTKEVILLNEDLPMNAGLQAAFWIFATVVAPDNQATIPRVTPRGPAIGVAVPRCSANTALGARTARAVQEEVKAGPEAAAMA